MITPRIHCTRLSKHQDLRKMLAAWVIEEDILAATILSSVGSLSSVNLRLANTEKHYTSREPHEIISLNGTLSKHGLHLHLSVADSTGKVWGGHLMTDNLIFTTCELVIMIIPDFEFFREHDSSTGFRELKIAPNPLRLAK
ncbi:MAG: DNA-binding protein [Bdellovibrionales bacterium]|nr:DNA-binding protein [Bdellovibrionales bacterium]